MTEEEAKKLVAECREFLKPLINKYPELACIVVGFGWREETDLPMGLIITDDKEGDTPETLDPVQAAAVYQISSNIERLAVRGLMSEIVRLHRSLAQVGKMINAEAEKVLGKDGLESETN